MVFLWDGEGETILQAGPPRKPLPSVLDIEPQSLISGGMYPGEYDGQELTCDTRGNISNLAGAYASDTAELALLVIRIKGSGGSFRITPKRQYVLVRLPLGEDWETIFVTQLQEPLRFEEAEIGKSLDQAIQWQDGATPGDAHPFGGLKIIEPQLQFKQKAGGVISKRARGGEVFARLEGKSENQAKGANAVRLIAALQELRAAGKRVGRISVNAVEHALYRENGQLYSITAVPGGLEFPADTELDPKRGL